ncbi:hypothetical protein [Crenobacter cavernae]|uniref:Uncharacterized protein n=1 Tax=Crenobacter cavernae TaxID=2290923 RepID=A0ABY0FC33_9NEIS|nr:hypothetical protein [Crenobacter cavernae]RXZ43425.1 hypothetical protein EBB06_09715 [Crenobacter cavernae]
MPASARSPASRASAWPPAAFSGSDAPDSGAAPDVATLAGAYSAQLTSSTLDFSVAADGKLTSAGGCAISGKIDGASRYGTARPATFTLAGCGADDGSYDGLALVPAGDAVPAKLRLVADNGSRIVDVYAF